jgi:hypothetical protein
VPASPRNKRATWCPTGETGASKPRLVHELQNGLPYRTYPPNITIDDWTDPYVQERFDVTAGMLVKFVPGPRVPPILASRQIDITIEVLWPPAAPAAEAPLLPSASAEAPAATPTPKRPSPAAEKECFLAIKKKRPNDPLSETKMLAEMKLRLGAPPVRKRVRELWRTLAPEWKQPVGHPLSKVSAKKSAAV